MLLISSSEKYLKTKYLIILLFIGLTEIKAQSIYPYKIVDRYCNCPEFSFDGKPGYNLKPVDSSVYENEIRLFIYPDHHGTRLMIVLKQFKNSTTGNFYYRRGQSFNYNWPDSAKNLKYWEHDPFWKFDLPTIGLDSAINSVINMNLPSSKSQNEFYKGPGYSTPYAISYKLGNKVGSFSFGDPNKFLKNNPEIKEFRTYKAILDILLPLIVPYSNTISQYPEKEFKKS